MNLGAWCSFHRPGGPQLPKMSLRDSLTACVHAKWFRVATDLEQVANLPVVISEWFLWGCVPCILDALQLFGSMHLAPLSWRTLAAQGPPLALLGMMVREARRGEQVKTDCSPFAASALGPFEGVFTHLPWGHASGWDMASSACWRICAAWACARQFRASRDLDQGKG